MGDPLNNRDLVYKGMGSTSKYAECGGLVEWHRPKCTTPRTAIRATFSGCTQMSPKGCRPFAPLCRACPTVNGGRRLFLCHAVLAADRAGRGTAVDWRPAVADQDVEALFSHASAHTCFSSSTTSILIVGKYTGTDEGSFCRTLQFCHGFESVSFIFGGYALSDAKKRDGR